MVKITFIDAHITLQVLLNFIHLNTIKAMFLIPLFHITLLMLNKFIEYQQSYRQITLFRMMLYLVMFVIPTKTNISHWSMELLP